jgi:hypothetical protein
MTNTRVWKAILGASMAGAICIPFGPTLFIYMNTKTAHRVRIKFEKFVHKSDLILFKNKVALIRIIIQVVWWKIWSIKDGCCGFALPDLATH